MPPAKSRCHDLAVTSFRYISMVFLDLKTISEDLLAGFDAKRGARTSLKEIERGDYEKIGK